MLSIPNSSVPKVSTGDWRIRLYAPLSTIPEKTDNTVGGIMYDIPPFCTIRLVQQNENLANISLVTEADTASSTIVPPSCTSRKILLTLEWDKNHVRVSTIRLISLV